MLSSPIQGIKALLLDIDGTVLDTREFICQAAEYALQQEGYPAVPRERIANAVGVAFDEFYFSILERRDIDVIPLMTAHRIFQLEHMDLSSAFPNTVATLTELKKRGYKIAAITNRMRTTLLPTMDAAAVTGFFDEIIAGDDVAEMKPSPVPVLEALKRFGMTRDEAVMVGDTDIDVNSGKAAGVKTGRAWYGFMGTKKTEAVADFELENDISELLGLFPPLK